MRPLSSLLLCLVLLSVTSIAKARDDGSPDTTIDEEQEQEELFDELPDRLLPEYFPCTVNGTRYACYNQDQQVQLNILEKKAKYWHSQWRLSEQLRLNLTELNVAIEEQLQLQREALSDYKERNDQLLRQLYEQIELKNKYRAEADSIDVWPLLIGGALGLLGVGLGVGIWVAN